MCVNQGSAKRPLEPYQNVHNILANKRHCSYRGKCVNVQHIQKICKEITWKKNTHIHSFIVLFLHIDMNKRSFNECRHCL